MGYINSRGLSVADSSACVCVCIAAKRRSTRDAHFPSAKYTIHPPSNTNISEFRQRPRHTHTHSHVNRQFLNVPYGLYLLISL